MIERLIRGSFRVTAGASLATAPGTFIFALFAAQPMLVLVAAYQLVTTLVLLALADL